MGRKRVMYPILVNKVEKKGRTKNELNKVIEWLTDIDEKKLKFLIESGVTYKEFMDRAKIHPNAHLITGMVSGYRVEDMGDAFIEKRELMRSQETQPSRY